MKRITKIFTTAIFVLLISVLFAFSVSAEGNGITSFSVNTDNASASSELSAVEWYLAADGCYYVFLPSSADCEEMTVWFEADGEVLCGETVLKNGEATSVFSAGGSYTLTCGEKSYTVKFLQAVNEGTIYINTESGNMDAVLADKEHKEPGDILVLDASGEVQYDGVLDYIKGRGNSTWTLEKKPYNIKLDKKADLFGMGEHKSWCLLAQHSDVTMIRNPLAYDLAVNLGISTTSATYHVNLYINGKYEGLYLITEKVDIGENRVDIYDLEGETEDVNEKDLDEYKLAGAQNSREFGSIKYADIPNDPDEITGGYLLELEKIYRYVNEASGFITDLGQAVVVKTPEYATKAQVEYISAYYQEFEDALYSDSGYNSLGKHYSEYINVEDLARVYIIYEFTSNFDGCSSSFYMWKDVDGKLQFGPIWDFDLSLGVGLPNDLINHVPSTGDPSLLYIQTCFIGNHAENKNALLAQAFSHNDFQELVETLWAEELATFYNTFYRNIDAYAAQIRSSIIMNGIRWNIFGTTDENSIISGFNGNVASVANFVSARFAFLEKAYADDTYFVKYDVGKYGKALVQDRTIYENGSAATVLAAPESTDGNYVFTCWTTNPDGSGDVYTEGNTITVTDNTKLYAQWEKKSTATSFINQLLQRIKEIIAKITEFFANIFK